MKAQWVRALAPRPDEELDIGTLVMLGKNLFSPSCLLIYPSSWEHTQCTEHNTQGCSDNTCYQHSVHTLRVLQRADQLHTMRAALASSTVLPVAFFLLFSLMIP